MSPFQRRPLWYKDAVIYEVHVKCFHDSRGDGMGDFRGLIGKLDYLKNLGVTAIWLLPFYPSPLRDDGYDIADYRDVHPAYGALEDFDAFLAGAHARGLYVITELVLNHTSDQHHWFQRARSAPAGSPERDFYVWSGDKDRYREARIIFRDYETSNWSWDPVTQAWYWHRFFSHQPDLNFDNPAVHAALFEVVDFWLDRGVDGLRLDAVPYLYEREGTSCENLPETHAFLRRLTAHVRDRYDHRMLLAEANQWPEDAAAYFGKGDSCDMAFHFPLMPRLYMALEMEDRFPVVDILDQTPGIPDSCQWAIFLRNHDELTLEMVTDEERDYMVRIYAKDRRARINLGIRRRLAPLLGNNRRKIELLNMLLLSLPGTPVLYYGDEIGMGDNFFLGDRNGVRTPMQWTPDRNAGFSMANAQQLYLPIVIDSEFHFETVNVETQERNPSSLLWWTRRALHLRRSHPALSRGKIRFLDPENSRLLAFLREWEGETVLIVANLSRHPQAGQFNLPEFEGCVPVELAGGTRFPAVGKSPYPVMLGAHDALWLLLQAAGSGPRSEPRPLPDLGEAGSLPEFLRDNGDLLETAVLLPHVTQAPWFAGRSRLIRNIRALDHIPLGSGEGVCLLLRAVFLDGEPQDYALILGFVDGRTLGTVPDSALLAQIRLGGNNGWLCEGQHLPKIQGDILKWALQPGSGNTGAGTVDVQVLTSGITDETALGPMQIQDSGGDEIRLLLPGTGVLRWFRRPYEGQHPDLELLSELNSPTEGFTPRSLSSVRYQVRGGELRLLAYAQSWVAAHRSVEDLAMEHLHRYLEDVSALGLQSSEPPGLRPFRIKFQDLPERQQELLRGSWREFALLLGRRLAGLHAALHRCRTNPDFAPEPFTLLHQQSVYQSIRIPLRKHLGRLAKEANSLPPGLLPLAMEAVEMEGELLGRLKLLIERRFDADRTRIHGDLGLDRVLFTGKDFIFTGFDGEPWRSVSERRYKFCPLRDAAALLQAFSVCAEKSLERHAEAQDGSALPAWARQWADLSGALMLDAYLEAGENGNEGFLPRNPADIPILLQAFRIERASQELKASLGVDAPRAAAAVLGLLRACGG